MGLNKLMAFVLIQGIQQKPFKPSIQNVSRWKKCYIKQTIKNASASSILTQRQKYMFSTQFKVASLDLSQARVIQVLLCLIQVGMMPHELSQNCIPFQKGYRRCWKEKKLRRKKHQNFIQSFHSKSGWCSTETSVRVTGKCSLNLFTVMETSSEL